MGHDSEEKILKDWNSPIWAQSVESHVHLPRFRTFDELYRYLKMRGNKQGKTMRFTEHPYDNLREFQDSSSDSVRSILKRDKLKEKLAVSKCAGFLKRVREFKKRS